MSPWQALVVVLVGAAVAVALVRRAFRERVRRELLACLAEAAPQVHVLHAGPLQPRSDA